MGVLSKSLPLYAASFSGSAPSVAQSGFADLGRAKY